jgi:hypothetical protein
LFSLVLEEQNTTLEELQSIISFKLYDNEHLKLKTVYVHNFKEYNVYNIKDGVYYLELRSNSLIEVVDLDEEKIKKISIANTELKKIIDDGLYMHTTYGVKQFSFEEHDQRNIVNICLYLNDNPDIIQFNYHANGEISMPFLREELLNLRDLMLSHINEWTSKFHIFKQQVNASTSLEELNNLNLSSIQLPQIETDEEIEE